MYSLASEFSQGLAGGEAAMTSSEDVAAQKAKSQYETQRYKGLQDYMKAEKASEKPVAASPLAKGAAGTSPEQDPATAAGANYYNAINLQQDLNQRTQALRQEEQRVKNLAPEDRANANITIERMQKDIDTAQDKLYKMQEKHLGEEYSLLDSVHDQASLDGARAYAKRGIEAMADKAIQDKKIDPSNRDAFVRDNLNKLLPENYDEAGKAMLDTRKNGMVSITDQINMKKADAANKRALAEMEKADAQNRRYIMLAERQISSGDMRVLAEERQNITNQVAANNKMIEDYEREIAAQTKDMTGMPSTISTGFFGLSSSVNPDKDVVKKRIESLRGAVDSLRESNSQLSLQRDVLMKKEGVSSPPKTPSKPSPESSDVESAAKDAWGSYDPDKFDYRINPDTGKIQRKAK